MNRQTLAQRAKLAHKVRMAERRKRQDLRDQSGAVRHAMKTATPDMRAMWAKVLRTLSGAGK